MEYKKKRLHFLIIVLLVIFCCFNLVGCGADKEPIIGEWEFDYVMRGDEMVTSEMLKTLGYDDNAEIFFSCQEEEYSLGLPSDLVINDEWHVDTDEVFSANYAYTYLLDENGEMRAVIESEEDLDTLWIFIISDGGVQLVAFNRSNQ